MSTENGISIFSPTNRQFRNWTRGQGLMSTCFNAGSGVLRANGNTVFGSTDGALNSPKHRDAQNRRFTYDIQRFPYFLPNCISQ